MFERIGKITDTKLGYDHGIMTFVLMFDFGGSGQSFGGYALSSYDEKEKCSVGTAPGMDLVLGILNACGVRKWEDIKGKVMYALYDENDIKIKGIKNLLFEAGGTFLIDDWRRKWFGDADEKVDTL